MGNDPTVILALQRALEQNSQIALALAEQAKRHQEQLGRVNETLLAELQKTREIERKTALFVDHAAPVVPGIEDPREFFTVPVNDDIFGNFGAEFQTPPPTDDAT